MFEYFAIRYLEKSFPSFPPDQHEIAIQFLKTSRYVNHSYIKKKLLSAKYRRGQIDEAEARFLGHIPNKKEDPNSAKDRHQQDTAAQSTIRGARDKEIGTHRRNNTSLQDREARFPDIHGKTRYFFGFLRNVFLLAEPLWAYHSILRDVLIHGVNGAQPTYGIGTKLSRHTGDGNAKITRSERKYQDLLEGIYESLSDENTPGWIQQVHDATKEEQLEKDGLPFIDLLPHFFEALGGDIGGGNSMLCSQYTQKLKTLLFPRGARDEERVALCTKAFKQLVSLPSLLNNNTLTVDDLSDLSDWLKLIGDKDPQKALAGILTESAEKKHEPPSLEDEEHDEEDETLELTKEQLKRVAIVNHMHEMLVERNAVLSKYVFGQLIQGASINPVNRDGGLPEFFENLSGREDLSPPETIPEVAEGDVNRPAVETELQDWSNARTSNQQPSDEMLFGCNPALGEIQDASETIRNWEGDQDSAWDGQSYAHRLIMVAAGTKSLETLTQLIQKATKDLP